MSTFIEQLNDAIERCRKEEYMVSMYVFGKSIHVSLSKNTYGSGTSVKTEGKGETVEEAFKAAFDNFPKSPLDGSRWVSSQLVKPTVAEDASFTEET